MKIMQSLELFTHRVLSNSESFVFKRKGSCAPPMSTLDLLRWSMQIAAGLDYLGSLGVIFKIISCIEKCKPPYLIDHSWRSRNS